MKFAILSDTHDNLKNFNRAINWLNEQKIGIALHCGDICNQETINEAQNNFDGKIYFVRGNGDFNLEKISEKQEIMLDGKKIFFNHYPDIAKKAAKSGKYDLIFYGHTHKPWLEEIGNCKLVNPGEIAGQRFKPTFAVYDTKEDKLELKILEKLD